MKKRIIALICVLAMLVSACSMTIYTSAYTIREDVIGTHLTGSALSTWMTNNFQATSPVSDNEYSLVFVGDTQRLTYADFRSTLDGDASNDTSYLKSVYKWIADNVETKNIKHVFALGDLTECSVGNDATIVGASIQSYATGEEEWKIHRAATDQLKGKVPFSVIRGNHDDYMIDKYYGGDSDYTSQFGGFYSGSEGHWSYSANSGYKSITNSWKTLNIGDEKYLFITIDYNGPSAALTWAGEVIAANPDHKVIITTHSYLDSAGYYMSHEIDKDSYLTHYGVTTEKVWTDLASQYENVVMVVGGHSGVDDVVYNFAEGVHGNKVLQVLVCPQEIDKNYAYTGLICIMNFSEGGKKIEIEYYSPLLNMYKKGNFDTIRLDNKLTTYSGSIDMSSLAKYGQDNLYVNTPAATAPTLDGTISSNEYTVTRVINQSDAPKGAYESDLTEYFAYDDDYIYYAFSTKLTKNPQVQFQFLNQLVYSSSQELNENHNDRNVVRFKVNDDNSLSNVQLATKTNCATMLLNKDVFIKATRNTSTSVNTYELKLSRKYFALNNIDDTKLGYWLYLGTDSSGLDIWHYWNVPLRAQNALGISRGYTYNYAFFGSFVETKQGASVRLSSVKTGLRFKTLIDKNFINDLIAEYGAGNVSVGTLIAPADRLGGAKLTHSVGTVNEDYIDVPAIVDQPFESNATTNVYAGSLVNIKDYNLDRDFVGVGYVKVSIAGSDPIYYYSPSECTRNVSAVAAAAYSDVKPVKDTTEYLYLVNSEDKYNAQYSPYTEAQRVILKSLIISKTTKDPFDYDIF